MEYTLKYWIDEGWFVGKLLDVPGVFSQGETLEELIDNIREVYKLMSEEDVEIINHSQGAKLLELVI